MDPWNFVTANRYKEALALYDAELSERPRYAPLLANRATILLCLGRYEEALEGFRQASAAEPPEQRNTTYFNKIGAVQWIMGDRQSAIETFHLTVARVIDGTIAYTDSSGGTSSSLLLWYSGVTTRDSKIVDEALNSMMRLAGRPLIESWPGPLALFVLGRVEFEAVLLDRFQITNIDELSTKAKLDVLVRRELTQALFYRAVYSRRVGDLTYCQDHLRRCASLKNPHLEVEWYLARHEIGAPMKD